MSSETTTLVQQPATKGAFAPPRAGDIRSPCPVINSLANHGYIARNGKNITSNELYAALSHVGLGIGLKTLLATPIYNIRQDAQTERIESDMGFFKKLWYRICNPWSVLAKLGMCNQGQNNSQGKPVLNLDQLAYPGIVEHDISLTRRDHAQKQGNTVPQKDLIEDLLRCSKDSKTLTIEDLAAFRKLRIQRQLDENPGVVYGASQHTLACGEISLILNVFGNGSSVPCEYARAIFAEERLPVKEGWKKRWWTVGLYQVHRTGERVKKLIGLKY